MLKSMSGECLRRVGNWDNELINCDRNEINQKFECCQTAFENVPIAISVTSEGIIVYANLRCMELFGVKRVEEYLGQPAIDWIAHDNREVIMEMQLRLEQGVEIENDIETVGIRKDNREFNFHLTVRPWHHNSTDFNVNIISEIIRKRPVEAKFSKKELHFITIAEKFKVGFLIFDCSKCEYLYMNKELERITGLSSEDVCRNKELLLKVFHPDDHKVIKAQWNRNYKQYFEFRIINKKGEVRWYSSKRHAAKDAGKKIDHVVGIVTDITESKMAREKELLYKNQLVQADKLVRLGLLVSGIAHEINNPNNFISLSAPLLRKAWDCVLPLLERHHNETQNLQIGSIAFSDFATSIDKLLNGIEDGSRRIKRIVAELKDYSRKDIQNSKCQINLNEVVISAITLMEPMARKCTKNMKCTLWETPLIIEGNFQRLEQVVINLIHNACDALTKNVQSIFISTAIQDNKFIIISVRDEGCGISEKDLKRLEEPFFTTKYEKGGTGLGLSVSAGIMKDHNGKIQYESKLGKGTTVSLIFDTGR